MQNALQRMPEGRIVNKILHSRPGRRSRKEKILDDIGDDMRRWDMCRRTDVSGGGNGRGQNLTRTVTGDEICKSL